MSGLQCPYCKNEDDSMIEFVCELMPRIWKVMCTVCTKMWVVKKGVDFDYE